MSPEERLDVYVKVRIEQLRNMYRRGLEANDTLLSHVALMKFVELIDLAQHMGIKTESIARFLASVR